MNAAKLNTTERKELLMSFLTKGQIGSVEFIKADGSFRKANIKLLVVKKLTSGDKADVKTNPVAHKEHLLTACDLDKEEGWINLDVRKLIKAKFAGEVYEFVENLS